MYISQEQLDNFKEIYLQEFNIFLTDKEANSKAAALLTLMKAILKHKENIKKIA